MRYLLVILCLLLGGCAGARQASDAPVRVVVIGSSTAEGAGASVPDSAWVNRYRAYLTAQHPASEVVNLARGGYTTYHLRPTGSVPEGDRPAPDPARNVTHALSLEPDVLIINLPSNDAARGYGVREQMENYDAILAAAEAAGVPVWVATPQPRNLDPAGRQIQAALRDATHARFGARTLDFWSGLAREDHTLDPAFDSGDGIHLNDAGHRLLFERVRDAEIPEALVSNDHQ